MSGTEYIGVTKDGVPVVVRNDGTHYRAFRKAAEVTPSGTFAKDEVVGQPFIRFSDLSAALGLKMDGQRPETIPEVGKVVRDNPPMEEVAVNPAPILKAVTKDGVKVLVINDGTHFSARTLTDELVGSPKILLIDLGRELGLTFESDNGQPGPERTEVEAEKAHLAEEQRKAEAQLEAEIAAEEAERKRINAAPAIYHNQKGEEISGSEEVPSTREEVMADPAGVAGPLDSSGPERE